VFPLCADVGLREGRSLQGGGTGSSQRDGQRAAAVA
jgi:hypothetical protein